MKLYINKNCSGYFWSESNLPENDEGQADKCTFRMERSSGISHHSALLKGLMSSSQYSYCLAKDNGNFILALNKIPESRKDTFGRSISVTLIFMTEKRAELSLICKILFDYFENALDFSTLIDKCFASDIMSNPPSVICNWIKLRGYLDRISKQKINPKDIPLLQNVSQQLLIVSPDCPRLMSELGFKESEIKKAEIVLSSMSRPILLPLDINGNTEVEVAKESVAENCELSNPVKDEKDTVIEASKDDSNQSGSPAEMRDDFEKSSSDSEECQVLQEEVLNKLEAEIEALERIKDTLAKDYAGMSKSIEWLANEHSQLADLVNGYIKKFKVLVISNYVLAIAILLSIIVYIIK